MWHFVVQAVPSLSDLQQGCWYQAFEKKKSTYANLYTFQDSN